MIVSERMIHIQEEILKCKRNLAEVKKLGGHSCYAAGFEEGLLGALMDELEFLQGLSNGNQAYDCRKAYYLP